MQFGSPNRFALWTDEGRNDKAAEVSFAQRGPNTLDIALSAPGSALTYLVLRWDRPIPLGTRVLGDHWERGYGDLEWRGLSPERALPWYAILHGPADGSSQAVGVETGGASLASWRLDNEGVSLVLDLRCGGLGVRLGDRALRAATVRWLSSEAGESPFAFARRVCRQLCPSPRLPKQPVYGGNDWYSRYGDISDKTVRADAALIRDLSPDPHNPPFHVIDASWFPARGCEGGPYDRGHPGFPDMPGLAEHLKATGVRPGIWFRPLLTTEKVPDAWRVPKGHPFGGVPGCYLDPSVPEVLERVKADARRLVGWGYELLKFDFTTYDITGRWGFQMQPEITPGGWAFADRSRTSAEVVCGLYQALREAAGEAMLLGCNTIGHLGAGLFEVQRAGDDTSGKQWERTRRMGINTLAFRMPQHDAFYAMDADCVGFTPTLPWEMNRLWLDVVSRSGTPLFVSVTSDSVGPEQRWALREALGRSARPLPPGEPLDWMTTTCPSRWRFGDETVTYNWIRFDESAFASA
ncbi:MAG TPA: hypothetical protein VGN26_05080 [Armatimonadota bacterium]|jgi:alpha-galactosidase